MAAMEQSPLSTAIDHIEELIFVIRGKRILLDHDLARLYGVATFNLNKAVKRNANRFPNDFMFQLTNQELANLIFQNGISSRRSHGGRRTPPLAFTQEGVAMLSSVLRSDRAVTVNIAIMRAFVRLKELVTQNKDVAKRLDELENKYDSQFKAVFTAIRELMSAHTVPRKRIIGLDDATST